MYYRKNSGFTNSVYSEIFVFILGTHARPDVFLKIVYCNSFQSKWVYLMLVVFERLHSLFKYVLYTNNEVIEIKKFKTKTEYFKLFEQLQHSNNRLNSK